MGVISSIAYSRMALIYKFEFLSWINVYIRQYLLPTSLKGWAPILSKLTPLSIKWKLKIFEIADTLLCYL